ncbi:MAG TPA: ATP-binding protein [Planctomycetota bacterium]|nr:ATP-binding protein [Planctomycetota bacterium]
MLTGIVYDLVILALAAACLELAILYRRERGRRIAAETARARESAARGELFARLAAAAAHELKNPLNTIVLTLGFLERLLGREKAIEGRASFEKYLASATSEADKIGRTVESFVEMARPRELALAQVDVAAVVAHAVEAERTRRNGAVAGIDVAVEAGPAPARVDAKELQRVVEEVIDNAYDAVLATAAGAPAGPTPPAGKGRVEVSCRRAPSGEVRIVVRDSGEGFTPRALERAFEPYFSTKPERAGLGLARSRLIVEAHGGRIHAANRAAAGGAEVEIELPR